MSIKSKSSNPGKLFNIDKEARKFYPKMRSEKPMPTISQCKLIVVHNSEYPHKKCHRLIQAA